MRDTAGHLVEGGEYRDLVLDGLGVKRLARQRHGACHDGRKKRPSGESLPIHGNRSVSHHAAHLMPPTPVRGLPPGALL